MADPRSHAREVAARYLAAGDPTGWFEDLYAQAAAGQANIPWADMRPNPHLIQHFAEAQRSTRATAMVVGTGLGDDAEFLADKGFTTTALDIAPTAIDWCRRRFPDSRVRYVVANLLEPPNEWRSAFDFVFEAYTLQSLPDSIRGDAMQQIASFVAPGGQLLIVCRGRDPSETTSTIPWPLTRPELATFQHYGLIAESFQDFVDYEKIPVRRFLALFSRPSETAT